MPAKKTVLTDAKRAKRIREAAAKLGASDDPKVLDRALKKVGTRSQTNEDFWRETVLA